MLLPKAVGKIAMTSLPWRRLWMAVSCSGFKTTALFSQRIFKSDNALVNISAIFLFCFDEKICSVSRNSPKYLTDRRAFWTNRNDPYGGIRTDSKKPPLCAGSFSVAPAPISSWFFSPRPPLLLSNQNHHATQPIIFYFKETFCFPHIGKYVTCKMFISKAFWRTCRKNTSPVLIDTNCSFKL